MVRHHHYSPPSHGLSRKHLVHLHLDNGFEPRASLQTTPLAAESVHNGLGGVSGDRLLEGVACIRPACMTCIICAMEPLNGTASYPPASNSTKMIL